MPESTATQHGVVVGTPFYMSPEQARGQVTDERTDLYALGCILFRMISGRPPYEGDTVMDIVSAHMGQPVPVVESPFGPLPDSVVSLVAKAMSKRTEDRPQSAVEMGADLDRTLAAFPPPGPLVTEEVRLPTVLFVDDDTSFLALVEQALHGELWRVLTTSDPLRALPLVEWEGVDVLVADLLMPEVRRVGPPRAGAEALPLDSPPGADLRGGRRAAGCA